MAKRIKEKRLFENLFGVVKQYVTRRSSVPMSEHEILEALSLPKEHLPILKKILKQLVNEKFLSHKNSRYRWRESDDQIVKGTIRMHPRGFGFLQPEDARLYEQDVFIPKNLTKNAVDGDIVEAVVSPSSISEKGPEGRIIAILKRGRTHIAGIITSVEKYGETFAYSPLLGAEQLITIKQGFDHPVRIGDRFVMEVCKWGGDESSTECRLSHYLGHISDPSKDIAAAIEEYQLRSDFPIEALKEAKSISSRIPALEIQQREDLRDVEVFTIDPDTARDFDDALSLHKDGKGIYHLGVHIADVSHYVQPESELNSEARARCNSTYFPGECIPMLPKELSNDICSLRPNVNRLTASVHMQLDSQGNIVNYRFSKSVIKSAKRFTYKEAKAVLDGKKKSPHAKTLQLMKELCLLLKEKRYERGSIEFAMPELVVLVDDQGIPVGTDFVEYDITHQLVEEFMLKANETVATHLSEKGLHIAYRVHEEPSQDSMSDFVSLATAFGYKLSKIPTAKEIQKLFDEAMKTSYGQFLATCYIRRMKLALYSPDNIGHFGLNLDYYCHFTSPIRRYADLIVHRTLFGDVSGYQQLEVISDHCSERERISARAEGNVLLLKKLRLLQTQCAKDPYQQFSAIVTRVKPFGLQFELLDFMIEGFIHVSEVGDDYYVFDPKKEKFSGDQHGETFQAGDRILVMISSIDLIYLECNWNMVGKVEE